MKALFNDKPTKTIVYFDTKSETPLDGYIIHKNYVFLELNRGELYLDFYIMPSKDGNCIILGYVPELSLVEQLNIDKVKLLKLMQYSKLFAKVLKDSLLKQSNNLFTVTKIQDVENPRVPKKLWCVKYASNIPYNNRIFDETLPEGQFFGQFLGELCTVADDYLGVYKAYCLDPTNKDWIRTPKIIGISKHAYQLHHANFCAFGESDFMICDPNLINVKKLLLKEGYILFTDCGMAYPFDSVVDAKHLLKPCLLMIRADLFFPELKKEQYSYNIMLSPIEDRWEASIYLDEQLMNLIRQHIFKCEDKTNKKIPFVLYKHFQITSHIWLNSLDHKQSESLSDYIDTNLNSDKNFLEKPFKDEGYKKMVINDNRLVYNVPLAIDFTNKIWNIPTAISDLVFYAHCISYEFYNFANNFDLLKKELKSRKKQQWIQLFSDIAGIAAKLHRFT